ncbi:hypothetical protein M0805_000415 [Coniferiporia weirii]|nr:hypothetical protein M0805_000415 [Coniferiporia weirii]
MLFITVDCGVHWKLDSQQEGPRSLRIVEAELAPLEGYEVLVKVHAVSLQYRDLAISTGEYPLGVRPNVVPCSDCAGEVLSVGANVKDFKVGDRVCTNVSPEYIFGDITPAMIDATFGGIADGMLTEYRQLPAYCLVHVPEHLSYEEASTLPCAAATAFNSLNGPIPLKGGDVVLVLGTGGVSIFALQFAKATGATVIATTSSSGKAEILKKLGATHVINYRETPDWDKEILKLTNGRGVDHVVEIGGAGTISRSLNSTRVSGSVHVIGFVDMKGDTSNMVLQILGNALNVRGILGLSRSQFESMNRLISATGLRPVIDQVFSYEDVPKALEYLQSQKHVGKVVVKVAKD